MKRAWNRKELWNNQLDEVYSLAFPARNMYIEERTPGDRQNEALYDGTLQNATSNLANKLVAEYFSSFSKFLKVVPGVAFEAAIENLEQREAILEELNKINAVHQAAIEASNFDQAIGEVMLDYAVGMGFMMVREGPSNRPLEYLAINPGNIAVGEGPNAEVWEYYRRHKVLPRLVEHTWGSFGGEFSKKWLDWANEEDNNGHRVLIEEAVYYDPKDDKWYMTLFGPNAEGALTEDSDEKTTILELEVPRMWLSPRWAVIAGEVWGRGPALEAMPDAQVLNKAKKLLLQNASVSLFPPMTAVDDIDFNPAQFSFEPAYINMVSRNGGPLGPAVQKLDIGGDLQMGQFIFEDIQSNVKRIMLDDQLPPLSGAVHTPTEIMARKQELEKNKAAPFGRMVNELIRPMAQMNLDILHKKKLINKVKLDGLIFDLQVLNPTAQAHREEEVLALERSMETVANINPAIIPMAYRVEHLPRWVADRLGVEPELLRTSQEVTQMQQMAAQAQLQQGGELPVAN
jgi:hypothetical protein